MRIAVTGKVGADHRPVKIAVRCFAAIVACSTGFSIPRISLHFGEHEIAWSARERGPEQSEARDLDKGKGFLDYKALQVTHLLERQALEIDLFPLVIEHLLPHYPNTATAGKLTFGQQWQDFQRRPANAKRGEPARTPLTQTEVNEFNEGFAPEIKRLGDKARAS